MTKAELDLHLHSREDLPCAIPMSLHMQRGLGILYRPLTRKQCLIVLQSEDRFRIKDGKLELMEADFDGESNKTIFLVHNYVTHQWPTMNYRDQ